MKLITFFINRLDQDSYAFSSTSEFERLYILSYDYSTHDKLSSYEFRPTDKNIKTKSEKIFTLAYLKSHAIIIESKESDKIDVSCAVVILLPFNEDNQEFTRNNYNLIEKNILIKMDLYGRFTEEHTLL